MIKDIIIHRRGREGSGKGGQVPESPPDAPRGLRTQRNGIRVEKTPATQ